MLNLILSPLVGTAGSKWKDHTVKGQKPRRAPATSTDRHRRFRMGDYDDPQAKEDGLMGALMRAHVRVRVEGEPAPDAGAEVSPGGDSTGAVDSR